MNNRIRIFGLGALLLATFPVCRVVAADAGENEAVVLDLDTALRMAVAASYEIQRGAMQTEIGRQRVREEGGIFDPALELRQERVSDTSAQPLDPFGARPPASRSLSDNYQAAVRGLLPTGGSYRLGFSTTNLRGTFNQFQNDYYSFLGVSVTQPLLRSAGAGSALADLRLARTERDEYLWLHRQDMLDTVTLAAFGYFDLMLARNALRVAQRSVALGEQLVRDNELRRDRGAMSAQDVVEARARAARRRDVLLDTRQAALAAENQLKRMLYVRFEEASGLRIETLEQQVEAPDDDEMFAAMAGAFEFRPDYQLAELAVERTRIEYRRAGSRALPAIDVVASFGYNGNDDSFGDSVSRVTDGDSESYSIGAVMSLPLPNRSGSARKRISALQVRRAELALEDFAQEVLRELDDARFAIEISRERVAMSHEARQLAAMSLEAEEKRLKAGTSSTFLVLEQQDALAEAELREARSELQLASAVAQFHRLTGRSLEAFGLADAASPALAP